MRVLLTLLVRPPLFISLSNILSSAARRSSPCRSAGFSAYPYPLFAHGLAQRPVGMAAGAQALRARVTDLQVERKRLEHKRAPAPASLPGSAAATQTALRALAAGCLSLPCLPPRRDMSLAASCKRVLLLPAVPPRRSRLAQLLGPHRLRRAPDARARGRARRLARMERDIRDGAEHCRRLAAEYPWVASERQFFGRPGGDYDWAARDPEAAFADLEKAEATLGRLGSGLNKRARYPDPNPNPRPE